VINLGYSLAHLGRVGSLARKRREDGDGEAREDAQQRRRLRYR